MKKSGGCVTPALLYDFPPYLCDSPAIEITVGGRIRDVYHRFHSQRQLIYRIAHGPAEVIQALSAHSPVEGSTDVGAEQSKIDIFQLVKHRVLTTCELETSHRRRGDVLGSL